ncbi:MAG: C-GCAxxG-C-C family protein [Desulfatirhabdiaceae bacterium]
MARTCGTCGALTGGVLGLNMVFGRSSAPESVENNYVADQALVEQFREIYGVSFFKNNQCSLY